MNFETNDTEIQDVKLIKGKRFLDDRGYFSETFKISDFTKLGLPTFVQDNISFSKKGVIRGLHWQSEPHSQGKLVCCLSGSILDIAVDIRLESPTFGKHVAIELTDQNLEFIWIPSGFAHGFQALRENTIVQYKVTNYWNPDAENSLNAFDPNLSIDWPIKDYLVSHKDSIAPDFESLLKF